MKRVYFFTVVLFFLSELGAFGYHRPSPADLPGPSGKRTVSDVLKKVGPHVEAHLKTLFEKAGVSYPPSRVAFITLKDELELEVWAEKDRQWAYVTTYDVYGASGGLGPKERAGDGQVPEGIYSVSELNPNSVFHLSMKLDYPNSFDREVARSEGRFDLGGDIYLHGKTKSRGCIAIGDRAIEELFVLAARVGIENVRVVIAPYDFRRSTPHSPLRISPPWLPELYERIGHELAKYGPQEVP
jgi:hypothetical protein